MALYDRTGVGYATTRRPDTRIAAEIHAALATMQSVINVGAGAGAYEPSSTVLAVEPSAVMIGQRPRAAAAAVRAVAESLPLRDDSADAALAVLTIHHWTDLAAGIKELVRVARRRLVILTWDHAVTREFWLLRDYLPAAARTDGRLAVPMDHLLDLLPGRVRVDPVLIAPDCSDGFGGAFWARPAAYLDPAVRAGMSLMALTSPAELTPGLTRLAADLHSGRWQERHADLLCRDSADLGYRLVTVDL